MRHELLRICAHSTNQVCKHVGQCDLQYLVEILSLLLTLLWIDPINFSNFWGVALLCFHFQFLGIRKFCCSVCAVHSEVHLVLNATQNYVDAQD